MKTSRAYWLCQVLGWGAYSAVGLFFTSRAVYLGTAQVLSWSAFFLYSVALTHLFRHLIRERQWALTITWRSGARLLLGAMMVAAIQTLLVLLIDFLLTRGHSNFRPSDALWLWVGVNGVSIFWTILYLAITSNRRARERDMTLELLRRETELRSLEAKINPHFLFNCLNSIRALVTEDPAKAQDMITRFAAILRYNLNRDLSRLAPLAEELEVARDYLALESIRFEDRLRVRFEIDPEAEKTLAPPMLLQTLVENALKHGISRLPEGGEVHIRALVRSGHLVLFVKNTGRLAAPRADAGVGLKVARERLRLLYNGKGVLKLTERTEDGVPKVAAIVIARAIT